MMQFCEFSHNSFFTQRFYRSTLLFIIPSFIHRHDQTVSNEIVVGCDLKNCGFVIVTYLSLVDTVTVVQKSQIWKITISSNMWLIVTGHFSMIAPRRTNSSSSSDPQIICSSRSAKCLTSLWEGEGRHKATFTVYTHILLACFVKEHSFLLATLSLFSYLPVSVITMLKC